MDQSNRTNVPIFVNKAISARQVTNLSLKIPPNLSTKINTFQFAGVFAIKDITTSEIIYINCAGNITKKVNAHIGQILNNNHYNARLQDKIKEIGLDNIEIVILKEVSNLNTIFDVEKEYIHQYKPIYNNPNKLAPPKPEIDTTSLIPGAWISDAKNEFGTRIINTYSLRPYVPPKPKLIFEIGREEDEDGNWVWKRTARFSNIVEQLTKPKSKPSTQLTANLIAKRIKVD